MRLKDVEKYPNDWLGSITHGDMMANDFPVIIDRTEGHVRRVDELNKKGYDNLTPGEKKEWNGVVKGAYNASDMNRVGDAETYLAELLHEAGYTVAVSPKRDWKREDIPTREQMLLYRSNAVAINKALSGNIPVLHPTKVLRLGFNTANTIEKYLLQTYENLQLVQQAYYYSGELFAGEV